MPPPTDQERQAFKRALQQSPAVLAAGGVLESGPKPGSATAAKDVRSQFPEQDLELDPAHQGSNSVFAASNLKLDNPEAVWRAQLPFVCADEASLENQLLQALFNQVEGRCIQFSTLKLFQWIATFIPHIHPQSTIQFEAKPSLTEIIEEMRADDLAANENGRSESRSELSRAQYPGEEFDPQPTYPHGCRRRRQRQGAYPFRGRRKSPRRNLLRRQRGRQLRRGSKGVQKAFKAMQFDRHSDFTLESSVDDVRDFPIRRAWRHGTRGTAGPRTSKR